MEKIYKSNLQYNSTKKRNSIVLCVILFIGILGLMSIFIAINAMDFILMTGAFLLFPIIMFPSIFMQYPTDGRQIIKITDKEITVHKETFKLKDVVSFKVIIEVPYTHADSDNLKFLNDLKNTKLEDEWYGNLDLVVKDSNGKKKMVYTHIDHVIDGMLTLIRLGIKNYELSFSQKKNKVVSEYDYRKDILDENDEQYKSLSKKDKKRQLI